MHHVLLYHLLLVLFSLVFFWSWGGTQGFVEFDCIGSLAISRYDTKSVYHKNDDFYSILDPPENPQI